MIVDTSVWVEYLQQKGSPGHLTLEAAIKDDKPITIPEVVRMELLIGGPSGGARCSTPSTWWPWSR